MLTKPAKVLCFCLATMLSGCATLQLNNLFNDYAKSMTPMRASVSANQLEKALSQIPSVSASNTNFQLHLLEQARLAFLNGQFEKSRDIFSHAYAIVEQEQSKANYRLGRGVEKFNALVTNDSAISYQLAPYEQSMLHTYQALNYLYTESLESALVEVRRANLVQEQALQQYELELIEAKNKDPGIDWQQVNANLSGLNNRIGDIKNGFQNAYTFYLSGLLYEASGQINDAYIDYKKALEIYPENEFLQQDVLRLGSVLDMDNDLKLLEQRYGKYQPTGNTNAGTRTDTGKLVVIYEQDLIDQKIEKSIKLPIFTRQDDMRFYSLAIPSYQASNLVERPLSLNIGDKTIETQVIVKLQALVAKQLKDQMPATIIRQALRLITKEQVRRKMSKEGGDVGNILAGLYSMASERADTRSWLTLPGDVQILKTPMPVGTHTLDIAGVNNLAPVNVDIKQGRITLVTVTHVGSFTQTKVTNL